MEPSIKTIQRLIETFVRDYKNRPSIRSNWKTPLVAVADAVDPLFRELKRVVGPTHRVPHDLLAGAKSVITFFVPFDHRIPKSNRDGRFSSKKWAQAYIETNLLITELSRFLVQKTEEMGYIATTIPPTHNFDKLKLLSDWSHKHVTYIAGLGDFGLHQMLITEKGCCGRLGSLVTTLPLEPTKRPEKPFCLYRANQRCQQCVNQCVFGALEIGKLDRHRCYEICIENDQYHRELGSTDICGKCACGIPCSFTNPVKDRKGGPCPPRLTHS